MINDGNYIEVGSVKSDSRPGFQHSQSHNFHAVSPEELMVAAESVINQVDWTQVARDVLGRKRADVFRATIDEILKLHIQQLQGQSTISQSISRDQQRDVRPSSNVDIKEVSLSVTPSVDLNEATASHGEEDNNSDTIGTDSGYEDVTDDEGEEYSDDTESNSEFEDGDYEEGEIRTE